MRCWRIVNKKWEAEAFSGDGARSAPGRWNLLGTAVVYCSENLSLAALELFMRIRTRGRYISYVRFQIDVPADVFVETIDAATLPDQWDCVPPLQYTKELGTQWAVEKRTAVLRVPAVPTPGEFNVILNPAHQDFAKIKIHTPPLPFSFDPRMWDGTPTSKKG
jgi:RES domain-containing protein